MPTSFALPAASRSLLPCFSFLVVGISPVVLYWHFVPAYRKPVLDLVMQLLYPTLFSLPFALASQVNTLAARADSDCTSTHIFLAKGNNEPYPGRQGKLVNSICSGLSSCDYEDILFYNPVESVYCDSVFEGAANGLNQIVAYNKRCPNSNLVISGSNGIKITIYVYIYIYINIKREGISSQKRF